MSRSDISTTHASAQVEDPGAKVLGAQPVVPQGGQDGDRAEASVWVLQSYRAGENTQLLGLAERLDRSFRAVSVRYRRVAGLLGLLRRTTLAGIDATSRAQFAPPWPDLVITAGLRNEPLCAYIRQASGGRTRIVFIGRSWRPNQDFDLLVTTPQYRVRPGPRVLVNLLTQHRVTPERLQQAAQRQAGLFAARGRPLIGVLLGGNSGPYVLGPASAERLHAQLAALVTTTGGSIAVSSSSRTPDDFYRALVARLEPDAFTYRWRPGDPDNPYYAMLALADVLVVTGDSVAMLSEAAAAGKPVLIFDIPTDACGDVTPAARIYRWMMQALPDRLTRDVALFHRQFVAAGHGRFLEGAGDPLIWAKSAPVEASPGTRSPETTRHRVEALLAAPAPGDPARQRDPRH